MCRPIRRRRFALACAGWALIISSTLAAEQAPGAGPPAAAAEPADVSAVQSDATTPVVDLTTNADDAGESDGQPARPPRRLEPNPNAKFFCAQTTQVAEPVWWGPTLTIDYEFAIKNLGTDVLHIRAKGG